MHTPTPLAGTVTRACCDTCPPPRAPMLSATFYAFPPTLCAPTHLLQPRLQAIHMEAVLAGQLLHLVTNNQLLCTHRTLGGGATDCLQGLGSVQGQHRKAGDCAFGCCGTAAGWLACCLLLDHAVRMRDRQ